MQTKDPIDLYFECISSCSVQGDDSVCIERCVEVLKNHDAKSDNN